MPQAPLQVPLMALAEAALSLAELQEARLARQPPLPLGVAVPRTGPADAPKREGRTSGAARVVGRTP